MKFICNLCGYEYDAKVGDIESGIDAGVDFDDLPDNWVCPFCGAGKEEFEPVAEDKDEEE